MPKDSHLLCPMSQELLRAARAGRIHNAPYQGANGYGGGALAGDDETKAGGEDDDAGAGREEVEKGCFVAPRWQVVPRHLEGPEVEYLAQRRKGLESSSTRSEHAGAKREAPAGVAIKRVTVRRTDADGKSTVEEVLMAEGQKIDGEILAEVALTDADRGTYVEGLGVVNAEGFVAGSAQATPNRRRAPVPKRKAKGTAKGRKKKVQFRPGASGMQAAVDLSGVKGTSLQTDSNGVFATTSTPGLPELMGGEVNADGSLRAPAIGGGDVEMADESIVQDGDDDDEEGEEGDDGEADEDDDREEGELSPTPEDDRTALSTDTREPVLEVAPAAAPAPSPATPASMLQGSSSSSSASIPAPQAPQISRRPSTPSAPRVPSIPSAPTTPMTPTTIPSTSRKSHALPSLSPHLPVSPHPRAAARSPAPASLPAQAILSVVSPTGTRAHEASTTPSTSLDLHPTGLRHPLPPRPAMPMSFAPPPRRASLGISPPNPLSTAEVHKHAPALGGDRRRASGPQLSSPVEKRDTSPRRREQYDTVMSDAPFGHGEHFKGRRGSATSSTGEWRLNANPASAVAASQIPMKRRASTPQEGVQGPLKKQSLFRSPVDGSLSRPSTGAREGSAVAPGFTPPIISPALSSAAVTSPPAEKGPISVLASTPTVQDHVEPRLPAGAESTERAVGTQGSDLVDRRTQAGGDGNEEAVVSSDIDRSNRQTIDGPPPSTRSVEQASKDVDTAVDYRAEGVSSVRTTSIEMAYIDDGRVDVISKLVSRLSPSDYSYDGDGSGFAGGKGVTKHALPRDDVGRDGIVVESAIVGENAAVAAAAASARVGTGAGSSTLTGATIPAADIPVADIVMADIDVPATGVSKTEIHTTDIPASPGRAKANTFAGDMSETTATATGNGTTDRDAADSFVGTTTTASDALPDGAPSKAAPPKAAPPEFPTDVPATDASASSKHAPSGPFSSELPVDGRVSSDPTSSGPATNVSASSDGDSKGGAKGDAKDDVKGDAKGDDPKGDPKGDAKGDTKGDTKGNAKETDGDTQMTG